MPRKKNSKPIDEALELFADVRPAQPPSPNDEVGPLPVVVDETGDKFVLFSTPKGEELQLRFDGEEPWATRKQMAGIYGTSSQVIDYHVKTIYDGSEFNDPASTTKETLVMGVNGQTYRTQVYSLDVILEIGHRVNSKQGILFRRWSRRVERQYLLKGFVVDTERMKNDGAPDALQEFRNIAREIRTSIRNSYREVLTLCTLCSDYDGTSDSAREFFMAMENKLLWAAANKTAPQLVLERANAEEPDMGLTNFAGKRGPTQKDVVIGNNYLAPGEQERKGRATEMWLTYVEEQLDQGRLPTMQVVVEKLDRFIRFNQWSLLQGKGHHSREVANAHALQELELYREWIKVEAEAGRIRK